ncbi:MAG: MFS transporter [Thermodesulfobacteriota bacterium]|nr:MFS transporter [Thermodesulfobacteriota bacterium]
MFMHKLFATALGYRWIIFSLLALQYLLVYFHRVCPALMAPELTDAFSISGASLGILSSGYFYPYALMQLPVGLLSDAWGARKTITLFALFGAVGAVLFGLSPGFKVATVSRIMVGFGLSAIFVPALRICAEWFRPREYAGISGMLLAMGGVGWFVAATPLAWMTTTFGWRGTFIGIGYVTAVLSVLTWIFTADTPQGKGFAPVLEHRAGATDSKSQNIFVSLLSVLKNRDFWPIAGWFFFFGGMLFGFCGLWAGPYLMDSYSFSKTEAGNVLAMIALGTMVGSPLLGNLSDRVIIGRKKVMFCSATILMTEWIVLFAFREALPRPFLYPLFFFLGVFGNAVAVVGFAMAKDLFSIEIAGTAVGAANFFAFLGAAFYQPMTGYLMDLIGKVNDVYPSEAYQIAFAFFLLTSITHFFCMTRIKDRRKSGYV